MTKITSKSELKDTDKMCFSCNDWFDDKDIVFDDFSGHYFCKNCYEDEIWTDENGCDLGGHPSSRFLENKIDRAMDEYKDRFN